MLSTYACACYNVTSLLEHNVADNVLKSATLLSATPERHSQNWERRRSATPFYQKERCGSGTPFFDKERERSGTLFPLFF